MEGTSKISTIQHSKRVEATAIELVVQAVIKVATVEKREVEGKMIILMSNTTIIKSLDILLVNVMPTRIIHKKLKQSLQGKRMMRVHC